MRRSFSDVDRLQSWHHEWQGLRVAVLGLGMTGFSVADTLVELGASVTVIAAAADPERADLLEVIGARLIISGSAAALTEVDPELVIVSPGIPPRHPLVQWSRDAGIPVWGDVELAWRLRDKHPQPAEWICVTGTNGKTTTVQLTTAMIAAEGRRVIACGNVGVPVLDAIRDPTGFDFLVVELSSFQLHYIHSVSAHSSVCLNVDSDHLDWHGSADAYAAAKAKVYERTRIACIYNLADDATRAMVENAEVVEGCRAVGFGLAVPGPSDVGLVDDIICDRAFIETRYTNALELTTVARLEAVGLGSPHMIANVIAASALARSIGVSAEAIRTATGGFSLDHHRTETIDEIDGVSFVDDSKATNPHAADAALRSFEHVVWIVGGLLKGVDLGPLVAQHVDRVRAAVVIGTDRAAVVAAFARHAPEVPVFEVERAETDRVMPTAVRLAVEAAKPGDVVLLAPAAASMDQFDDYADRGARFTAAVRNLREGRADDHEHPSPDRATPG